MSDFSVLFVCMGNICRSPTAQGIFTRYAQSIDKNIHVDSSGTINHHMGESPDIRAVSAAKQKGYDISHLKARQVSGNDFVEFDLILAMDKQNLDYLTKRAKKSGHQDKLDKIKLLLEFSRQVDYSEVPDPYYGGKAGFDLVINLIEDASSGLLEYIKQKID